MKTHLTHLLSGLFLSGLCTLAAHADIPVDFQLSGQAVYTQIKVANEKFTPSLFNFKADAEVTEGAFSGIGVQAVLGVPMTNSEKNGLTVDINSHSAFYITLTDPDADPNGIKFVVYVGYATTKLETQSPATGNYGKNTLDGTSYGLSLQQRVMANSPFSWTLDCTRFIKDSNMRIDGCGVGAAYEF